MFPTDNEFLTLYVAYIGLLIILLAGTFFSKKKKAFRKNLIFFSSYTLIMTFMFLDKDNFEYGNSLAVLFYGGIFLALHLIIFLLSRTYIYYSTRNRLRFDKTQNGTTEQ